MHANDRPAFAETLLGLAHMYHHKFIDAELELWWASMQGWEIADFRAAASVLLSRCEFMPKPADFRLLRSQVVEQTAAEEWARCLRECSRWRQGIIGDDNPATDRALKAIGGNESLAMCNTDKLQWLEKRFREAYEEAGEVLEARSRLPELAAPIMQGLLS